MHGCLALSMLLILTQQIGGYVRHSPIKQFIHMPGGEGGGGVVSEYASHELVK